MLAPILVFVVTYVLVSARRLSWLGLDRPAGALIGAAATVGLGVLTPQQALGAVDGATLLLLFGVMGMGAFLALDGFFDIVERRVRRVASTPAALLGWVIWGSGLLSPLITNDAVCVLGAPVVVRLIQRHRLPALPFLLGLATAANTGSVATLVGNPQNMLCGLLGELQYFPYALKALPLALAGLCLNHALLWWSFRAQLENLTLAEPESAPPVGARLLVTLAVIVATALVYSLGGHLAWTAAAGFALLMLIHRRDTRQLWSRIDWSLLVFFGALFVVVEGLVQSGAPQLVFEHLRAFEAQDGFDAWARHAVLFLVGSNLVSNVPFILMAAPQMASLPDERLAWELLAVTSTFAGNLTLLGSAANIIVAEAGRDVGGLGFWQYARVGFPLAVLTTALGMAWLWLLR